MSTVGQPKSAEEIQQDWDTNPRWKGVTRTYTPADVVALQGTVVEEATLARRGAEVLWRQLHDLEFVNALGALTGNMAVQQVRAGLKAIYLSGWQVAGDANLSGHTYPDQSLYRPTRCRRSCAASTTRCCAPTRSPRSRATPRSRTGSPRSSPTARPASVVR
jgi:isocitrate lyase